MHTLRFFHFMFLEYTRLFLRFQLFLRQVNKSVIRWLRSFCPKDYFRVMLQLVYTITQKKYKLTSRGGHFHIEGVGDVPLARVCILRLSRLKQGCLNQPNHWHRVSKSAYLATGMDLLRLSQDRISAQQCLWQVRDLVHPARRDASGARGDQYSNDP